MSGHRLDTPALNLPETARQKMKQLEMPIPYTYPTLDLLIQPRIEQRDTRAQDAQDALQLESTLQSFSIPAQVRRVTHGPAVTRFELELASGINVKRVTTVASNIALDLKSNGDVRIEPQIPGTNYVGVEVPNKEIRSVSLSEVLGSHEMQAATSALSVALGKDIAGMPIVCDLAKMPHLLIAGATGSGKSVCVNAIINSILFRSSPQQVRMILVDPKVVELQCYNVIPHLLIPVVSDPHKASAALSWAVAEMMDRYKKFKEKGVREITGYNASLDADIDPLPRILIIIDELADLMMACKKEVEGSICRIAQLARAAGIHLIVATQRPSVDVITGLIKANIPSRIAFAVSSNVDSRTILDMAGAEKLLGKGDMFFYPYGARSPLRVQGCFVSDQEVNDVVSFIGSHEETAFDPDIIETLEGAGGDGEEAADDTAVSSEGDPLLLEALGLCLAEGQASASMLMRRLKIGHSRAGRLIDELALRGYVSKFEGSKARRILITKEEFEQLQTQPF